MSNDTPTTPQQQSFKKELQDALTVQLSEISAVRTFLRTAIEAQIEQAPEEQKKALKETLGNFGTTADMNEKVDSLFKKHFDAFMKGMYTELCAGDVRVHDCFWCLGIEGLDAVMAALRNNGMEKVNTALKQFLFTFDDITRLHDRAVQKILREVDTNELAKALLIASEETRQKIYNNMSSRAANMLKDDMRCLGAVCRKDAQEAQKKILSTIERLHDAGEVLLPVYDAPADGELVAYE